MKKNNQNFRKSFPPLLFFSFILIFSFSSPVFADNKNQDTIIKIDQTLSSEEPDQSAPLLSDAQKETLASACGSIRTSLKNLQRSDSRARTYFGAIYEAVSSKYLTPLNLRLVKNDLSEPDLISAQTKLVSLRSAFSTDFITYSKSLEDLINLDCRLEPQKFYEQLLQTRKDRALVSEDMQKINKILTSLPDKINSLTNKLKTKQDAQQN